MIASVFRTKDPSRIEGAGGSGFTQNYWFYCILFFRIFSELHCRRPTDSIHRRFVSIVCVCVFARAQNENSPIVQWMVADNCEMNASR